MLAQALGMLVHVRFVFDVPSLRKCLYSEVGYARDVLCMAHQDNPGIVLCETEFDRLVHVCLNIRPVPQSKHFISVIKTSQLMLHGEIIAVCSQVHTKHIYMLWAKRVSLESLTWRCVQ
jgi:hypothetical protein